MSNESFINHFKINNTYIIKLYAFKLYAFAYFIILLSSLLVRTYKKLSLGALVLRN